LTGSHSYLNASIEDTDAAFLAGAMPAKIPYSLKVSSTIDYLFEYLHSWGGITAYVSTGSGLNDEQRRDI